MAEWTNLFDLGECTVSASRNGADDFSQVMAKGDSAAWGETHTVEVSEAGSVLIDGESFPDSGSMELRVALSEAVEHSGERLSGVVFASGVNTAAAYVTIGGVEAAFDQISPASPDPMVVTDLAGDHDFMAIRAEPAPS